jgi:hypothetical protein
MPRFYPAERPSKGGKRQPEPPSVQQVLRSAGQPLPEQARTEGQARLAHDFSQVRVHTDPAAAASAAAQQAEAYTVGSHIAFAAGRFQPQTKAGQELIIHELTHVIQQQQSPMPAGRLAVSSPDDAAERQAEQSAGGRQIDEYLATPAMVHRRFGIPVSHSGLHSNDAVIELDRFIGYVEEVERANPNDPPAEILSRLRVQYYGGENANDRMKFDQLIPDAKAYDSYIWYRLDSTGVVYTPRGLGSVSADARNHLLARADENGIGDNPSPYLKLPSGELVDVGHLFLAMDALLNPRTSEPYATFGIPNIDVSGWVADVGIASVWLTMARSGSPHPDDPVAKAHRPMTVEEYFQASAPEPDLLGDIDAFRLRRIWRDGVVPLSVALRRFYAGGGGFVALESRYAAFCSGAGIRYTFAGGMVTWDASQRADLIRQVDRFNDLYGGGIWGAIWGTLTSPTHRTWPDTPAMLDKFLAWLKPRLQADLRARSGMCY